MSVRAYGASTYEDNVAYGRRQTEPGFCLLKNKTLTVHFTAYLHLDWFPVFIFKNKDGLLAHHSMDLIGYVSLKIWRQASRLAPLATN